MSYTDADRLDFLEKWEVSIHEHTRFTLLTQHVRKDKYPTLREFCDYGIDFEKMLDENGIDVFSWHTIPQHLQIRVTDLWKSLGRPLNDSEKDYLQEAVDEYWEESLKAEDASDK